MKKMRCLGIVGRTGFNVYPEGKAPECVEFFNSTDPVEISDSAAECLSKMDPDRFVLVEEQGAGASEPVESAAEAAGSVQDNGKDNGQERPSQGRRGRRSKHPSVVG